MNRVSASQVLLLLHQEADKRRDDRLRISPATLRSWVHRGHISRTGPGYDLREILDYIESREKTVDKKFAVVIDQQPSGLRQGIRIVVDGLDIAPATVALSLDMNPTDVPKLTVDLLPGQLSVDLGQANVVVDDATRDVLLALGWAPPQSEAA